MCHVAGARTNPVAYDVVIYGGTSAGVAAAVQASRMGKSVVLIELTDRLGGLSSGGLGATDIGNKRVIGGIAREFYQRIGRHYADPRAWSLQTAEEYFRDRPRRPDDTAMWTFEPSVAHQVFRDWIAEAGVKAIYHERLDLMRGVRKKRARIEAIRMESGLVVKGRMFIDATYEGDLMAKAGVSYTIGREANRSYGETLNGVQSSRARHHQFFPGVDPYVRKGDPTSGLLPGIHANGPGEEGEGDHRVQAYCFRMCLTDHPENRIPFAKPANYNELDYELLLRNLEAGETAVLRDDRMPWINTLMPNRKTDTNNRSGVSTDFIGQNYEYADGDYEQREKITQRHRDYQQGLMWTLANHPRVPERIRSHVGQWGLTKDEFVETRGWPAQLYVREARRMIGVYVMTQHNAQGQRIVEDSVGMGAYQIDSHHTQRYVDAEGFVRNEGDVEVGGFRRTPSHIGR